MLLKNLGTVLTGAGKGLGSSLARELARRGARLFLVARTAADIESVAASIRASGGEAHAFPADVGDKHAVYPVAGAAAALVGPVGLVIHAASTLGPTPLPLLLDLDCEALERTFQVNTIGPFRLTKALAGPMVLEGKGLVIAISSDAAIGAYPGWGAYSASKAATDHLMRVWAAELEGTGVRFLEVDPGEMDTEMHAAAMPDADRTKLARPEAVARRIADLIERAEEYPSGARLEAAAVEVRS